VTSGDGSAEDDHWPVGDDVAIKACPLTRHDTPRTRVGRGRDARRASCTGADGATDAFLVGTMAASPPWSSPA